MIQIIGGAIALVLLLIVLAFLWTYFYYVLALVLGVVAVFGFLGALGFYKEYKMSDDDYIAEKRSDAEKAANGGTNFDAAAVLANKPGKYMIMFLAVVTILFGYGAYKSFNLNRQRDDCQTQRAHKQRNFGSTNEHH